MPHLQIAPRESLFFEEVAAPREGAPHFLFVNDLLGTAADWGPAATSLHEAGFGSVAFDFRGQGRSSRQPDTALTPGLMLEDLRRIIDQTAASAPILVGHGQGGLYAMQALLGGAPAAGLVLLNALREPGARYAWLDAAAPLIVGFGGGALYGDAMTPLLVSEAFLAEARARGGLRGVYAPPDPSHGLVDLLTRAGEADWDLPYEALDMPTLVVTGLQDRVYLDRDAVNRLFARLPDARAEAWEDAGHLLALERPEQLALSLSRFGREIEASPRV